MLTTIATLCLRHIVTVMMLGVGLATRPTDLTDLKRRPLLYVRGVLVMLIAVPLWTLLVVRALAIPPLGTLIFMIVAVCPGAPFLPLSTKRKGEHHSVVGLDMLIVVSVLAPLTIPLWVDVLGHILPFELEISALLVLERLLPTVLLPLAVGLAIRHFAPKVANPLGKVVHVVFLVMLAIAIVVGLELGAPVFLEVPARTILAVLLIVAGDFMLGVIAARPVVNEERTIGTAAALGNPGLALAVIAASYPDFRAIALVLAYVLARKVTLIPFEQWFKHRAKHRAVPA